MGDQVRLISNVLHELKEAETTLQNFMGDQEALDSVVEAANLLVSSFKKGGKVISCGNGGSHCDAMHFAEELTGRYRNDRPPYPAICISDPSHISCVGNDYGYEYVFSRFIEGVGQKGDVLFGISTSGNSINIINAVEVAKSKGMYTVLLTGGSGGKLAGYSDIEIRVPHFGYADRIQEVHIKIIHILIQLIEEGMSV